MSLIQQAIEAQARKTHEFLAKRNVVGTAVGYKNRLGEDTGKPSVVVLVQQKKPLSALTDEDIIPKEIDGMPTDVYEIGFLRAQRSPMARFRPVMQPGISMAHFRVGAGTLGAVVRHRQTGERFLLSNNHVFANSNHAQTGDFILQPGALDGGMNPSDAIGRLDKFRTLAYIEDAPLVPEPTPTQPTEPAPTQPTPETPPTSEGCDVVDVVAAFANALAGLSGSTKRVQTQSLGAQSASAQSSTGGSSPAEVPLNPSANLDNLMDAALVRPNDPSMFSDEVLNIGRIAGSKAPELGMRVVKSGRTTGFTEGRVTLLNATVNVQYETMRGTRTARFVNQVITSGMSKSGDSGSLVVDPADNYAVGLLFAGSEFATIFTPIDRVLSYFNVGF